MRLSDLVTPERTVIPLQAGSLRDAAWTLVERLASTGAVSDPAKLHRRAIEERGEDIVALGDRAFLTHYRTDAVHDLAVAIGIAPAPIARDSSDADVPPQQARIVLLILAPPRLAARYLQVLGAFARLLSRPEVVEAMLGAESPRELAALPALAEVELAPQLTVRDIMTPRPRTARSDDLLREAAREMVRADVSGLPVVDDDGRLVGMLSERELLRHLLSSVAHLGGVAHRPESVAEQSRRAVRDVMTRQVLAVSPDQPLAEVASLMVNKDVDRVPVVREGRLVGFLTRGDIVRKLIGS